MINGKLGLKTNQRHARDTDTEDVSILKKISIRISAKLSNNHQTVRSVIALMSSNITAAVLSAIGGLLVAHYLGPEVTGSFRVYTIPLTYLIFLHLGTWDGLLRQIPYYSGKDKLDQVEEIASVAGAFNIIISILVSIGFIGCAVYSLIHQNLFGVVGWLSQVFICWRIFYGGYLSSTYRTLHNFVSLSKVQVVCAIVTFGMVFLLPFLKFYGLCARAAFPSLLEVMLFHRFRPLKIKYCFNPRTLLSLIKIGLPFTFWGSLYSNIWFATESAMVLYFGGATSLGLLVVAVVIRNAINSLPMAIWQVLTPRVVTSYAKYGSVHKTNKKIIWVTVGMVVCMMFVVYIGSYLLETFVPYFIPMYIAGIPVMKVCLWFPVVNASFLPVNALFAKGRPWLFGRSVIAGVIVFPLVAYFLEPMLGGLLAVAVGSLFGRIARTLAAYVDLFLLTRQEV